MASRPLRLAFAGLAVLGAAVIGALLYDRLVRQGARPAAATRSAAERPAAVDADGAAPAAAMRGELPTVPAERPLFTLADTAGRRHSITEWDGKALVVNFWATWCAPCRRELPLLNHLQAEFAPRGIQVLGVAVDFAEDVRAFTREFPVAYPILVGEQDGLDAARAFGVATIGFPFTAFSDARGRIITVHMGELHEPEARTILDVVLKVDAGALTPGEARGVMTAALAALPGA
jgi:thiol-disulfide isomerase/thioredoxin